MTIGRSRPGRPFASSSLFLSFSLARKPRTQFLQCVWYPGAVLTVSTPPPGGCPQGCIDQVSVYLTEADFVLVVDDGCLSR